MQCKQFVTPATGGRITAPCGCEAFDVKENAAAGTQAFTAQYANLDGSPIGDTCQVASGGTFTFWAPNGQRFATGDIVGLVVPAGAITFVAIPRTV